VLLHLITVRQVRSCYVFMFHDSTFECVAEGVEFGVHPASEQVTLTVRVSGEAPHRSSL
jgi:hypothetical protein